MRNRLMNWQTVKFIALIAMTLDHIGAVLRPDTEAFRLFGRIAFPIFLFMLVNSYSHTSDKKKYLMRIMIFSIVSIWPYYMAFGHVFNVGYVFMLVLTVIGSIEVNENHRLCTGCLHYPALILGAMAALYTVLSDFIFNKENITYCGYAVGMGVLIYFRHKVSPTMYCSIAALISFMYGLCNIEIYASLMISLPVYWFLYLVEDRLIYMKQSYFEKYLYYAYYPAHLLVLSLMR